MTRVERSLKITQLLFDGNSTRNLVRQQKALVESALARLLSAKETTTLRAIQVYLEVLRRDEIVRLSEENLGYHDDTLEKINERFESGVGTKVDVIQTRGRQAQSKSNVLLAKRDKEDGRAQFYRVVGEYPTELVRPNSDSSRSKTLEETVGAALSNNPNIKAIEAEVQAAVSGKSKLVGFSFPVLIWN